MNEKLEVDTGIIRDIVLTTQESIADILTPLLDVSGEEYFKNASNEIFALIDNISMISDMSGLHGLNSLCAQYSEQIKSLPLTNSDETCTINDSLEEWLLYTLMYLDDIHSEESINQLIKVLLSNTDTVHKLLIHDSENVITLIGDAISSATDQNIDELNNSESDNNIGMDDSVEIDMDDIFADEEIDLDSADGVMALLCRELTELKPQFVELSHKITSTDNTISSNATNSYSEIISRINTTSNDLGLRGLVQICEFILKNLSLSLNDRDKFTNQIQPALEGWSDVVINHLQAPADDALCLAVVDYLELKSWPEPLKYGEIRDLINGLTKELELTGDYEVEARSSEARPEDVLLAFDDETSQEVIDAFFAEAPGYAESLTTHIANIVNGADVKDNTRAAQRVSHTLKGSANLIGTRGVANIAHHMEDIFEYLATKSITPPEPLGYTMQEAADTIELMIESLQGLSPPPINSQRILQDVLNWANRIDKGNLRRSTDIEIKQPDEENNIAASIDSTIETNLNVSATQELPSAKQQELTQAATQTEYLRVSRDTIDQVFNLVGETSITIAQIQEQLKRMNERGIDMRKQEKVLQARRFELENIVSIRGMASQQKKHLTTELDDFDSLEMDEYDEFYGATHSFIEAVSDTRESSHEVSAHIQELDGLFLQQQRLNHALQNLIMTTRMVPVKTIVARLQRAVRQACRATGKQAELVTIGDELLIDGNVLNQLADPLMHILRNAIDHGIETPEERFESGKPLSGNITLKFYQEGNSIRINCSDDGLGLDYNRIYEIAIEKDLVKKGEDLEKSAIARVILNSGFSTRDVATQISGRGVGMDVVHTAILNLKGNIEINDNLPSGTTFNLRLPITLLTSHSILVNANKKQYAIPTSMLEQILPPDTGKFSRIGSDLTYQLGKDFYPAKSLAQLLGLNEISESTINEKDTVLLVNFGSEIYAVTIENVISSYDLVVKNLGKYVKSISGIAGVALLGDGNVVPVLDLVELLDSQKSNTKKIKRNASRTPEKSELAKVLIVDDSLSVRKSLSQLIQDAGYEALLARDGIDALEIMQKTTPNLILTDLEMPRMTGLELTTHLRSNPENEKLPIIMITSRTMVKHQEQAKKAGVQAYITKPFSEEDLVDRIGVALDG